MVLIDKIKAYKVIDNRINYTIEVLVNNKYRGACPSGASTGKAEAKTKDVDESIYLINQIAEKYKGEDINFDIVDRELKFLKDRIGANGTTALSYAFFNTCLEWDNTKEYKFPLPLANTIGGGKHNGFTSIQEFLILPKKATTFLEAIDKVKVMYNTLKTKMRKRFYGYNDEGAMIIKEKDEKILEVMSNTLTGEYYYGVDMAASSFYNPKTKKYEFSGKKYTREEFIDIVIELARKYKIYYLEDPLEENDFKGFSEVRRKLRKSIVVGDDLTTTNSNRLKKAIKEKAIKGIIIKPNQIGTIHEAIEAKELAENSNIIPVLSHRSGEVDDYTLSNLAVYYDFKIIKAGIAQSRIPKLNGLIRLWNSLEKKKMHYLK